MSIKVHAFQGGRSGKTSHGQGEGGSMTLRYGAFRSSPVKNAESGLNYIQVEIGSHKSQQSLAMSLQAGPRGLARSPIIFQLRARYVGTATTLKMLVSERADPWKFAA